MSKFIRCLLGLMVGALALHADTVTLKSGDKVEGKILRESDTDVTVEVKVSASITDERVISKTEVEKIDKQSAEDIAFEEIKNLKPNPATSLTSAAYDQAIAALRSFQGAYPASAHHADVQAVLDAFEEEKKHADNGEVKFRGAWISKDEAAKMKTQILGEQLFNTMKEQGASGDLVGALNTFDRIEKDAKGAMIFPDAASYAGQVLTSLKGEVDRLLVVEDHNRQDFQKLLALTMEPKKSQLLATSKREEEQADAQLAAAQKAGAKWVPLLPRSQKSLDTLQKAIPAEVTRIAALPVQKMRDANARVAKAQAAIDAKDWTTADTLLKEATALWADNEDAKYYGEILTASKATAAVTPTPTPSVPPKRPTAAELAAAAAAQTPTETGKPFFLTIPGAMTIIGVVILIVGGITLMGRMRTPTDEPPE